MERPGVETDMPSLPSSPVETRHGSADDFMALSRERPPGFLEEFWEFLKHNKKWWLLPILVTMLLLGALVFLGSGAATPFIYPFF